MKLVRYQGPGGARVGIVDGDHLLDAGTDLINAAPGEAVGAVADATLLAPTVPSKILCAGLNYRDHAEESGMPIPAKPLLFAKFPNTIVGPGEPIRMPSISEQIDYEAELGVVIGARASGVGVGDALEHVLGYTCLNDVSARDLQFAEPQWIRGKSLDSFCPIGPWIVTRDEIPDPQALGIRCIVNGEKLQDSSTEQMVFGVAELIAFISESITLEPGDLIATGTPPGVGFARTPPVWLKTGDTITVEIDGIGALTNRVA